MPVVTACCDFVKQMGNHFSGSWIVDRLGGAWVPNLKRLVTLGLLEREELTRGGRRRYYRLIDPEGASRALRELGFGA